jgi:broad specificity phosphatase PhoE
MAELFLVRHAQAAFGTDDYDRLTELGHRQARWLGEYFAARGMAFDRVLTGTLRRHRETLAGIATADAALPGAEEIEGLNEYRADALITAYQAARGLPPVDHGADCKPTRTRHSRRFPPVRGARSSACAKALHGAC